VKKQEDTMPALPQAVDRVVVQVLVDNVTDSLSTVPSNVVHEWRALVRAGMTELAGSCQCCANHGLSLVITAFRGDLRHTMLFDAGPLDDAIVWNGRRLGIDFAAIDGVMLSHGHWDHAGGMLAALALIREGRGDDPVPCYLHPEMFRQRALTLADGTVLPIRAIASPDAIAHAGATPVMTREPLTALDGMFYLSGEIPRETAYERGFPGHLRRTPAGDGWEPDPLIVDERFLAVRLKEHGVVVFTACSHAGVVNVLRHARNVFGTWPLHAVIGGFHLAGRNEAIIPETVRDIGTFGLRYIVPGHCTGWRATAALAAAYGDDRVVPLAVGRELTF
jgi:7,8-dihydropterin-6-yl-methyl-4-(beta-D-ribofuranosyl)aminobenzene 5'-phosphate synthase